MAQALIAENRPLKIDVSLSAQANARSVVLELPLHQLQQHLERTAGQRDQCEFGEAINDSTLTSAVA